MGHDEQTRATCRVGSAAGVYWLICECGWASGVSARAEQVGTEWDRHLAEMHGDA